MLVSIVRLLVIFLCVTQCLAVKILSQSISAKPAAGIRKGLRHYDGNDGKDDDGDCDDWDCDVDGDDDDDDGQDDDEDQESCLYTTEWFTTEVPVTYEVLVTTSVNGKLTTITYPFTTELSISTFVTDPAITSSKTDTDTITTTTTTSYSTTSTDVISSTTTIVTTTATSIAGCYLFDTFTGDDNTFQMYMKQETQFMAEEMCYYSCTHSTHFSGVSAPWYMGLRGVTLFEDKHNSIQMNLYQCFCMKTKPSTTATNCYTGDNGILYGNGDPTKGDFSIAVLQVNS